MKWEFTRAAEGDEQVRHLQRRRGRAGHVQGPRHPHRAAGPALRRHDHRRLRHRRRRGHPVPARRVRLPAGVPGERAGRAAQGTGLLGKNICGKEGFDFDIRIQMGAGAYICGEETVADQLVRGPARRSEEPPAVPRPEGLPRPPDGGQQRRDASAASPRILEKGPAGSPSIGSQGSAGHQAAEHLRRLQRPGVYEVPFGIKLQRSAEAWPGPRTPRPCRSAGPAGRWSARTEFGRTICYDDLATGGSVMVFGPQRDMLEVADDVHGVLHRGELRLLHALPRGQRAAEGAAGQDPRGQGRAGRPGLPARSWARRSRSPAGAGWARPRPTRS